MTRLTVSEEMITVPDSEQPIWWPYCVSDGCYNRVCTWRSGHWCFPCCDAHGVINPRADEF